MKTKITSAALFFFIFLPVFAMAEPTRPLSDLPGVLWEMFLADFKFAIFLFVAIVAAGIFAGKMMDKIDERRGDVLDREAVDVDDLDD